MFGYSTKGTEIWTVPPTYNYWTRNVVPQYCNIMSVKPDQVESGFNTQHNFGREKFFSSSFDQITWLNLYCLLTVRLLLVATIVFVTFISQMSSQYFVNCQLSHPSLSSSLPFWFPSTVKQKPLKYHSHQLLCLLILRNCDKSVTTQNLAFLSYWYRKKHLQIHL